MGQQKCYHTHTGLQINGGGIEVTVYGGSCIQPVILNADIYVGLDSNMKMHRQHYPWVKGHAFLFDIPNMGVPASINEFRKLLKWLTIQLAADKMVHIGCIGGHGRTGLVLSALVKYITGNPCATQYVRDNYCEKAVESDSQVAWLWNHFKIEPVAPRYKGTPVILQPKGEKFTKSSSNVIDMIDFKD